MEGKEHKDYSSSDFQESQEGHDNQTQKLHKYRQNSDEDEKYEGTDSEGIPISDDPESNTFSRACEGESNYQASSSVNFSRADDQEPIPMDISSYARSLRCIMATQNIEQKPNVKIAYSLSEAAVIVKVLSEIGTQSQSPNDPSEQMSINKSSDSGATNVHVDNSETCVSKFHESLKSGIIDVNQSMAAHLALIDKLEYDENKTKTQEACIQKLEALVEQNNTKIRKQESEINRMNDRIATLSSELKKVKGEKDMLLKMNENVCASLDIHPQPYGGLETCMLLTTKIHEALETSKQCDNFDHAEMFNVLFENFKRNSKDYDLEQDSLNCDMNNSEGYKIAKVLKSVSVTSFESLTIKLSTFHKNTQEKLVKEILSNREFPEINHFHLKGALNYEIKDIMPSLKEFIPKVIESLAIEGFNCDWKSIYGIVHEINTSLQAITLRGNAIIGEEVNITDDLVIKPNKVSNLKDITFDKCSISGNKEEKLKDFMEYLASSMKLLKNLQRISYSKSDDDDELDNDEVEDMLNETKKSHMIK